MTCVQSASTISTLVLTYLVFKLIRKLIIAESKEKSKNSLQLLEREGYIEVEAKSDIKDKRKLGNSTTISISEVKLKKPGKHTTQIKSKEKPNLEKYTTKSNVGSIQKLVEVRKK